MTHDPDTWPPGEQRTTGEILKRQAELTPDKVFVRCTDVEFTYKTFDDWVNRLARGLTAQGIVKGSKVALMLPNGSEFLGIWFACARIGAVEVPINTNLRGPLLRHVLKQSDSELLITRAEHLFELDKVLDDLPKLSGLVLCPNENGTMPNNDRGHILFGDLEDFDASPIECNVHPRDPLAIIFTSGTTGPSKGAVLSHHYYWWFGNRSGELRQMTDGDVLYTCLPLFHVNAQVLTVMSALLHGQTAVLDTHFTASGFWERLRDFGATQFNYIGGMIPILMKQPPSPDDANNQLRVALGAAAPKNQWRAFEERFGLRLLECYGQTEDCVVTVNPLSETRIGSVGKADWGYDMQAVDDDGHQVPDGTVGEFVIRPKWPGILMDGYYNMPDETMEAFRDLWFHTGDYGSRDADGYFYFMDRKKDAMRRRGENISAYEVEVVVNEHPNVVESAVFAVPSDVGEDDVMVAVILKENSPLSGEELLRYCEENLAYFAVPRYVDFRPELPKTPTYKVEKYKLRKQGVTATTWDREKAGYKLRRA